MRAYSVHPGAVATELASLRLTRWPGDEREVKKFPADALEGGPKLTLRGRNGPRTTRHVAEVVAALHGVSVEHVADATTRNAVALFGEDILSPLSRESDPGTKDGAEDGAEDGHARGDGRPR